MYRCGWWKLSLATLPTTGDLSARFATGRFRAPCRPSSAYSSTLLARVGYERFGSDKQPVRAQLVMMRYFFHLEDGVCVRDPKGVDFTDDAAALVEAAAIAEELSKHGLNAYEWRVVVKNAKGARIGSAPLESDPSARAQAVPPPSKTVH